TMKFGFEHQHLRFTILQPPSGRGAWSFSGVYTEVPSQGGGNTGLAQLLLTPIKGTVSGASDFVGGADNVQASNYANTDMGRNYNAAYIQDEWKATPKLTANLGLRSEERRVGKECRSRGWRRNSKKDGCSIVIV